ncbi:reverse transcriptase-like protein [Candidatus Saccharibacteria bacterium]|nr:reverse transcriptase-like protein [Candidatus Saccharibacteria bacterium]MBR3378357.1 reverse transcriptase-like protein [Candidatus Saccharibacteria bacterium]
MKQRIRVSAICKKGGDILLLKRAGGRVDGMEIDFELPTGKIIFGEQPEEAMARVLYEHTGIKTASLQLMDVVTFTSLEGSSQLGSLYIIYEVKIDDDAAVKITSERYSAYKWTSLNETTNYPLDEATMMVLQITSSKGVEVHAKLRKIGEGEQVLPASDMATIYTDGGSRGNPGPSGIGYYIVGADGREIKRGGEFLGMSNSRLAEYYGLKEGIEQALELGLKRVSFKSDSLMMVNQLNGVYKVKNLDLMQVYTDVLGLLSKLDSYSFTHVPREQNKEADAEVNRVIDENTTRGEY